MENFFFPLKSVTDSWLSSSTTPWVMDVILGILCGLGLFLLLCAFFPSNPPGPLPQRKTNARKSLGDKQETATTQPFWITKDKQQQLSRSLKQYPMGSEDPLQQKCSQLYWGLPSLHSESLVATAWVSSKPAPCSSNSVKFNRPSSTISVQIVADIPSQLPQGQPLPHAAPLPQPVPQNLSPPGAQFKSQDSLPSSVPTLPCSSHTKNCRTSQPATQKRARFLIVTGEQQQEQSLQNPQKWKSVNTELRKPQASFGQATPSLSQDSGASETHQSVPTLLGDSISPEVQGQQQRHTQQRLIKFRYPERPPWEFQEQMQPQGKFPEEYPSRTRDRAEHSQPSLVMGKSSKVVRKVRGRPYIRFCEVPAEVKREKSPDEDPGQNLKRSPGDLPRGSRLSSQEVLQDAQGETERPTTRLWKCDSDNFHLSSPDENHFQKTLKAPGQ
ncbi:LOW QUALITY PROTEIN: spermatogenesis-associated protein 31E1-like [Tupaia chinensis]|uniref:LOW QUALITY PROTEIN: spermatogenesis-associated protein 31E1-like n=1 Tax=Tupaia chinensis TaxID=246437 RepID=UPI000703D01F|nr:LOW QUALITY PROTEIN: spermatogenesis-associated protein 31E1-like [Tupaia chinensis]